MRSFTGGFYFPFSNLRLSCDGVLYEIGKPYLVYHPLSISSNWRIPVNYYYLGDIK